MSAANNDILSALISFFRRTHPILFDPAFATRPDSPRHLYFLTMLCPAYHIS